MKQIELFFTKENKWITNIDLLNLLRNIEADKCDILYIHSAISFGTPNQILKRKELLEAIYTVLMELQVKTICMPTFTFSFCNNKIYDPITSSSKMGALNEFFRKQDGVIRSCDPLMSVAVFGEDKDLVTGIGNESIGIGSTFDKLRHRKNVKFLFLGTKIGDCFTYMHYLEWYYKVNYRYEKWFKGDIEINGQISQSSNSLFVRHYGVLPNDGSYKYEQMMYNNNLATIVDFGDSTISIVEESKAAEAYRKCLDIDPFYFVTVENDNYLQDTRFILEKEMVAL